MNERITKALFHAASLGIPMVFDDGECAQIISELDYLENEKNQAEKLRQVIIGMFPMWIAAMSYCEHGRKSDLMSMRNYYNGRDNKMTSEDIHFMFSVIPEKGK